MRELYVQTIPQGASFFATRNSYKKAAIFQVQNHIGKCNILSRLGAVSNMNFWEKILYLFNLIKSSRNMNRILLAELK